MAIAYLNALVARNITDGRALMCPCSPSIGNNSGKDGVEFGKLHDIY